MFLLTFSIAVTDEHTRLARVETDTPFLATLGAACVDLVHPGHHQPIIAVEDKLPPRAWGT